MVDTGLRLALVVNEDVRGIFSLHIHLPDGERVYCDINIPEAELREQAEEMFDAMVEIIPKLREQIVNYDQGNSPAD